MLSSHPNPHILHMLCVYLSISSFLVALTAMGGAAVATSVSVSAMALIFGTAGAGLASYKMDKRTIGIKEFKIEDHGGDKKACSLVLYYFFFISD